RPRADFGRTPRAQTTRVWVRLFSLALPSPMVWPARSVPQRQTLGKQAQGSGSDHFHSYGRRFAAADAQRGDAALPPALPEGVEQGDDDARAAGADRMAERGRAAMDVDLLVRDADVLHREHGDAGERLVDFPQVDVAHRPAGSLEHLVDRAD